MSLEELVDDQMSDRAEQYFYLAIWYDSRIEEAFLVEDVTHVVIVETPVVQGIGDGVSRFGDSVSTASGAGFLRWDSHLLFLYRTRIRVCAIDERSNREVAWLSGLSLPVGVGA